MLRQGREKEKWRWSIYLYRGFNEGARMEMDVKKVENPRGSRAISLCDAPLSYYLVLLLFL
jgi:hypothetical protein